jgi:hypothetical protein
VTARAIELKLRRERLVEKSARLRFELGSEASALSARFTFADRITALARSGVVRALAIAAAALLLFGRPKALFRSATRLLVLWPLLRPLLPKLDRLWRGE